MSEEALVKAKLEMYGEIFGELMQSPRFVTFLNTNFDIHRELDEENKVMTYRVIEVPHEEVAKRIRALIPEKEQVLQGPMEEATNKPKKLPKKGLIVSGKATPVKALSKSMEKRIKAQMEKDGKDEN